MQREVMEDSTVAELELLERYAAATRQKILVSQADLGEKIAVAKGMLAWCRQYNDLVVLENGAILTSSPGSRNIQNCKVVMMNQGLHPGKVVPALKTLVNILLENLNAEEKKKQASEAGTVSAQQHRLRVLVEEAIKAKVSDIHLEVRPDVARIRFRKHGELYLHAEWLSKLGREIASVAFNKETDHAVTHFNPLVPQSASMPLILEGMEVRLRLASLPAHGGFDVVMRILDTFDTHISPLEELGYTNAQREIIKRATAMPHGAIIISGPTGSGKTTTLASCVSMIGPESKVYTVEDPVEKIVPSVTQVPVNSEQSDRTFASMGIASLRMDPDVIVLGEMRDTATAVVMLRAAMTGHLVFSTIHTNTSLGIITRLVDLGISEVLLADPDMLVCLISQRLLPLLCETCAKPLASMESYTPYVPKWREALGKDIEKVRVRGGEECPNCGGLGIKGRSVVAEVVWIDEEGRSYIKKLDNLAWEKYLRQQGWASLRDRTLQLLKEGRCDPLDAEKVIGSINVAFYAKNFDYNNKSFEEDAGKF